MSGKGRGRFLGEILKPEDKPKDETADSGKITHSDIGASQSPNVSDNTSSGRGRGRFLKTEKSLLDSGVGQSPTLSGSAGRGSRGRGRFFETISTTSSEPDQKDPGHISIGQYEQSFQSEIATLVSSESGDKSKSDVKEITEQMQETKIDPSKDKSIISSLSEPQAEKRKGSFGREIESSTNYLRLKSDPNKGVFEYEVLFNPPVDARALRMKYLNEHRDVIGFTKTFDGRILYLPIRLPQQQLCLNSKNPNDNSNVEIKITYKRQKSLRECIQLYNILFDRVMRTLKYVRFDRKQYDPTKPKQIPQYKLEIWPGYVTAVDEYEGGVMLCCDVSHRVLCTETVLDKLRELQRLFRSDIHNYQINAQKTLLGTVVLTRYNNKNYRIDDINFKENPKSTFKLANGNEISYMDYYKSQYGIHIQDERQPLLISYKTRRVAGKDEPEDIMFCLIPEICHLTGLQKNIIDDKKVMRELATFTRVTPTQRVAALKQFCENVANNEEACQILSNWGLELSPDINIIKCRQYPEEKIQFLEKTVSAGVGASFQRDSTNSKLLEIINIDKWVLIYTSKSSDAANKFKNFIDVVAKPMGITIAKPFVKILNDDRNEAFVKALNENIKSDTKIVVVIFPNQREDRYSIVKRICCVEKPVPSQVIIANTLKDDRKARSVVQKVVLQMNCKLGGTLWSISIPLKGVMICGIDSFHDPSQRDNSVAGFVASINASFTKWYSRPVVQTKKEEIVGGLRLSLQKALQAYENMNNCLPERIMIYRDGVGDGQLKVCSEYEVPQFEDACSAYKQGYNPKLTFIVVQKRINTRIFMKQRSNEYKNPEPGFVLDHTVTRKHLYDFFLISQQVMQGTVSPTHYIVLRDDADFSPDIIQRISYKLCFLYYNWPGTVRVPACCQYAHKLAFLVGESIRKATSESLATRLYYL